VYREILHLRPCASDAVRFLCGLLREYSEQTGNGSQKGNTFYEGRSQDHVTANVVRSFRLTGNSVYCAFTDLADTDTGANGCKACTQRTVTGLNYIQQSGHQRHLIWFYN
jgi:hypothetical protein